MPSTVSTNRTRSAFTLIELLVVIAIIAILAIVVILTLNPGQLILQARDSNRFADMATLTSALNYYAEDSAGNGSQYLGLTSTTYVSIPDPTATSSLGDQCQGLGLPSLASGYTYHCASTSTVRLVNGQGWIPINLSSMSTGPDLGQWPVDPVNQSSSNLFYTYQTNGTEYEVTAIPESQKEKLALATQPMLPLYPDVIAQGSNLTLSGLWNQAGLVGYWPLNEGSGTIAYDLSGNGNNGSWSGTMAGTNGYYGGGKVGPYAGYFDGTTDSVSGAVLGVNTSANQPNTFSFWIKSTSPYGTIPFNTGSNGYDFWFDNSSCVGINTYNADVYGATTPPPVGQWNLITIVIYNGNFVADGSQIYFNGIPQTMTQCSGGPLLTHAASTSTVVGRYIGGGLYFGGLIGDVRIYSRALSAAEVQALYNAEH